MNPSPEHPHSSTGQGLLFALLGFSALSIGDALVKSMAGQWPGTAIGALRYVYGTVLLGTVIAATAGRAGFAVRRIDLQWVRAGAIALAAISFFFAVQLMPLAQATSIQFTSPILVAMLSPWLLGERAPRTALLCIVLALIGVAVVLRPNLLAMGPAALLPLVGALGLAVLVIFNRKSQGTASIIAMQFWVAALATPILIFAALAGHFSGIAFLHVPPPTPIVLVKCAGVATTGTIAHWLIYIATQRASATVVAPMVYVQLLVAGLIGWFAFGNSIDPITGVGMAVIVCAGLLLWRSQRDPMLTVPPD